LPAPGARIDYADFIKEVSEMINLTHEQKIILRWLVHAHKDEMSEEEHVPLLDKLDRMIADDGVRLVVCRVPSFRN